MYKTIDQYISDNDINNALSQCLRESKYHFGLLLAKIYNNSVQNAQFHELYSQLQKSADGVDTDGNQIEVSENIIADNPKLIDEEPEPKAEPETEPKAETEPETKFTRVMLYCSWTDSKSLCDSWNKMSKGDYKWNNIQVVWEEPSDYYVVINKPPPDIELDLKKTIFFCMEPNMGRRPDIWGEWSNPSHDLLFRGVHEMHYNNNEWWLSKTYNQLMVDEIKKDAEVSEILSTVLSDKYSDPGHIKRIDFVKFIESKSFPIHVYGGNKFLWKDYKGSPPHRNKDSAMMPYKYTFNVENHSYKNYYTEKLIDGILSECLVFYNGCSNIRNHFDSNAFVWLELSNFEADFKKIKDAIANNLWEERLPYIKAAKQKILQERQFFPRIEGIINNVSNKT